MSRRTAPNRRLQDGQSEAPQDIASSTERMRTSCMANSSIGQAPACPQEMEAHGGALQGSASSVKKMSVALPELFDLFPTKIL
jgi:hypothetical protein